MSFMKPKTLPLDAERVRALQEEINAFIDERAAAEQKECPNVPFQVIRNLITARAQQCECRAYLQIKDQA